VKRVAVLASGRGSNLAALLGAQDRYSSYRIVLVVSNVEGAGALGLAREASVEAICLTSRGLSRDDHERSLADLIRSRGADIICLAGYMRVLTPAFIESVDRPILNIHPSLLPAFPGMHAQNQALEGGVRWTGATVHFVDKGLDSGPVIVQEPVPVHPDDTEETLSARILETEHRIYPQALDIVAREAYRLDGRKVRLSQ